MIRHSRYCGHVKGPAEAALVGALSSVYKTVPMRAGYGIAHHVRFG